jgi:glycosyltransferase involved in cell wall biosynthesis
MAVTPTVGLVMIVKNEAANLPRLAASLQGHIDRWTLVDTGSADDTRAVAPQVFGSVPGEIAERPWNGYGPARNAAIELGAPHTDWLLTLDADDTFHGRIDRAQLDRAAAVQAEYRFGELRWWVPRLFPARAGWSWHGRCHEYLSGPGTAERTSAFHVVHHGDGGNRATKAERELGLLQLDWSDGHDPGRTSFYLARTYDDMEDHRRAVEWYERRLGFEGWEPETFYARWRHGANLLAVSEVDRACGGLWSTWQSRPTRAEPLHTLAAHYRTSGQWQLAWTALTLARAVPEPADDLFVHADVYRWKIDYEISITAWHAGHIDEGRAAHQRLLGRGDLAPWAREAVEANRRWYASG